jgi:hypothetical protein
MKERLVSSLLLFVVVVLRLPAPAIAQSVEEVIFARGFGGADIEKIASTGSGRGK